MVEITFGSRPIQIAVGENTGEARRAAASAAASAAAALVTLGEVETAETDALGAITTARDDALADVSAEGAVQVGLAAAEKAAAQAARTGAETARDETLTARDTVVAAAGLTPTRGASYPALFFDQSGGSYVDLPDYTNQPGPAANDWYIVVEALAGPMPGAGTVERLLTAATGGNAREVTMPQFGATTNKRILAGAFNLNGTSFIRNATLRAGTSGIFLRPLDRFVAVIASINGIPHFAAMRGDGLHFASKGDTNFVAGTGWFFGSAFTSLTSITRASNELILNASTASPFSATVVGDCIFVPGIGARVVTSKPTSLQIRCYDPGPDAGSGLGTTFWGPSSNYKTLYRMFNRAGANSTAGESWLGGIARILTRWGTTNLPGEFAAELVDGDGYLKQSWLQSIVNGTYKTLPGANRATLDFGAATIGTGIAFTGGSPASQPTITGTTRKGEQVDQPSWLRLAPGQAPHNLVHAQEFGQAFGSVRMTFQSDAMPYGAVATVYDRDPRQAGATVVMTATPIWSAASQNDPTAIVGTVHRVPANSAYWMRVALANAGPEVNGNSNYVVDFPCPVGFVHVDVQQSLTGDAIKLFTGATGMTQSSGLATVTGAWSGGVTTAGSRNGMPSDAGLVKSVAFATSTRIQNTTTWPNAMVAWGNVFLDGASAAYGRTGAAMFVPMVRNGHNKYDLINDGQTFRVSAGVNTAGASFNLSAVAPFSGSSLWTEPGTVKVYANGSLVASDNYASRTTNTAPWTNGLAGTWNYNNWGGGSITLPYAATIEVEARCRITSTAADGSTRLNYGAAVTSDDYSYFGIDNLEGSGNLVDNIYKMKSVTAVHDSWTYWGLSGWGSGVSDTDARNNLRTAFINCRARFLRYPQFANLRTGAPVPWYVAPEQRQTNLDANLHRARWLVEEMAAANIGFSLLPGCLTNQGDASPFSHPDALGALQVMQQKALALASAQGLIAGEHHKIFRVVGGVRLSSNSIRLYITPNQYGIGQHDAAATAFAGLWYGAANTYWSPAYVDTSAWTYTINNSTTNPYIDLTSPGALAAGYYDLNRGPVIPTSAGTKATQDTLLTRTLCVLNGGYDASLTRRGSDVHYSNTVAGVYIA